MATWNDLLAKESRLYEDEEIEEIEDEDENTGEDIYADEADMEKYPDLEDDTFYCPECGSAIDGTLCDICGKIVLL